MSEKVWSGTMKFMQQATWHQLRVLTGSKWALDARTRPRLKADDARCVSAKHWAQCVCVCVGVCVCVCVCVCVWCACVYVWVAWHLMHMVHLSQMSWSIHFLLDIICVRFWVQPYSKVRILYYEEEAVLLYNKFICTRSNKI